MHFTLYRVLLYIYGAEKKLSFQVPKTEVQHFFFDKSGGRTYIKRKHRHPNKVGTQRTSILCRQTQNIIKKMEKNMYKRGTRPRPSKQEEKKTKTENKNKKLKFNIDYQNLVYIEIIYC